MAVLTYPLLKEMWSLFLTITLCKKRRRLQASIPQQRPITIQLWFDEENMSQCSCVLFCNSASPKKLLSVWHEKPQAWLG